MKLITYNLKCILYTEDVNLFSGAASIFAACYSVKRLGEFRLQTALGILCPWQMLHFTTSVPAVLQNAFQWNC